MAMAAQTLTLALSASPLPKTLTLKPFSLIKPLAVLASSCSVSPLLRTARPFELGFVTRVIMSDLDMEQGEDEEGSFSEEDSLGEEEEEEVRAPVVRDDSMDLRLFVGNLPYTVDSAQLAGIFADIGEVEMVEVIYDKITGRSRGFGFVTMSSAEEAASAVRKLDGYMLDGRDIRVRSGPPPPKDPNSPRFSSSPRASSGYGGSAQSSEDSRVYVGNLSWGVDEAALQQVFGQQGRVLDAKVIYDRETGRSRGFGFVTFESAGDADAAINELNGTDLDGRSIRVTIAESRQRRSF